MTYEEEMQRRWLELNARSAFDRVGDQTRHDLLGMAQKDSEFATNVGAHEMREQNRLNIDNPVWPIIGGGIGSPITSTTVITQTYSTDAITTQTTWANATDHTQTFGTPQGGLWIWDLNLFIAVQLTLDIDVTVFINFDLLDGTGAQLSTSQEIITWSNAGTNTVGLPTFGVEQLPTFNAFRTRLTGGPFDLDSFGFITCQLYRPPNNVKIVTLSTLTA